MLRVLLLFTLIPLVACHQRPATEFDSLIYLIEHGQTPQEMQRLRAGLREYPERSDEAVRRLANVIADPSVSVGQRLDLVSILEEYPEQGLPVMQSMPQSSDAMTRAFAQTAVQEMEQKLAKKQAAKGH